MCLFHMRSVKERPKLKNKLEQKMKLSQPEHTDTCVNLANCHARVKGMNLKRNKEICILCDPFAKVLLNSIIMCFAIQRLVILLLFSPLDFKISLSNKVKFRSIQRSYFIRSVTKISGALIKPTNSLSGAPNEKI